MPTDPARIQSWYLHRRRICESIGADALALAGVNGADWEVIAGDGISAGSLARVSLGIVSWAQRVSPPTFEQLLLRGEIEEGRVCTLHRSFYSKGLPRFLALSPEKRKVSPPPFLYTKISLDSREHRVEIPFYPSTLTTLHRSHPIASSLEEIDSSS